MTISQRRKLEIIIPIVTTITLIAMFIYGRSNYDPPEWTRPSPQMTKHTLVKMEFGCHHLETLEQLDELARTGQRVAEFIGDQIKSGECFGFGIGTSVRIDNQSKLDTCVTPIGSSEACWWIASEVVK